MSGKYSPPIGALADPPFLEWTQLVAIDLVGAELQRVGENVVPTWVRVYDGIRRVNPSPLSELRA
jgi:hypothetical protein